MNARRVEEPRCSPSPGRHRRGRGKDENLPQSALNLRVGQQFRTCPSEHARISEEGQLSGAGNVFQLHCNQQQQNLPAGAKPAGPVGRNPSEAQSNISFSSFSRSLPAAEKDLEHLSAASCRQKHTHAASKRLVLSDTFQLTTISEG